MLKFALKAGLLLLVAWAAYKAVTVFRLRNFNASDFQGQVGYLSTDLLRKLDKFADRIKVLGGSVMVSPAAGAVMRFSSDPSEAGNNSQHYLGRAVDIMLPNGPKLREAYAVAEEIGFNGIGVYPDWQPYPGMHLDVRLKTNRKGDPDKWAGLKRGGKLVYVDLESGFYA